jgi:hypothetical protein
LLGRRRVTSKPCGQLPGRKRQLLFILDAGFELAGRHRQIRRRRSLREERYGEEACSRERPNILRY